MITYSNVGTQYRYGHIDLSAEYEILIAIRHPICIELCTKIPNAGNLVLGYENGEFREV